MVFGEHTTFVHSIINHAEAQWDIKEPMGNYKVSIVKIFEPNQREVGYIITLTDITKYMGMLDELNHLASRDALTGVFNRRYFFELFLFEIEQSRHRHHRGQTPLLAH